ncbi:MAG: cell division protein FtsZ [Hyphomicrobiaceae bacterium]|nr:cell division protein FtsZ [Hyphomicrobiaceae bacterium]
MSLQLKMPDIRELKPRITVFGVGGAGGNAVNNMITAGLKGVDFVVANTDAQALTMSKCERIVQMGVAVTEGLGAGSQPEVGAAAAEEVIDEINDHLQGSHMVFITAGMGGGTGTGAAPVVARAARDMGILTVGVVTKPFHFEGQRRMRMADLGITELSKSVDTLIVIPNQNLFRIANERTTFADAFSMADQVLYSGVACITDLMVKEGLINLDFADVRSIMRGMGKAMMGTGEATGEKRAMAAAEAAIANPLLDETSMRGARGLLISITGGKDMTLFEVDEAATRIREEVDSDANIILGATFDDALEGVIRVSVVATGIDQIEGQVQRPDPRMAEIASRAKATVRPVEPARPAPVMTAPRMETAPVPAPQPARVEAAPAAVAPRYEAPAPVAPTTASLAQLTAEIAQSRAAIEARIEQALAIPDPAAALEAALLEEPVDLPNFIQAPVQQPAPAPVAEAPRYAVAPPQPAPVQQPVQQAPVYSAPREDMRNMPRIPTREEFPPIAQKQFEPPHAQQAPGPMSMLRRLTNNLTGHGHRDDVAAAQPTQPREPSFQQAPASEFSKRAPMPAPRPEPQARSATGNLDANGRQQPRFAGEDDQLDIPAFLRRQANN